MIRRLSWACALLASACCLGADLTQRLDALTQTGPPGRGVAGIQVVEAATGKVVYRRNADHLFLPASNLKLFTTALALTRLGAEYRFATRVVREASGDLVLVGSGDPSLSGRAFPYQRDAIAGPPLAAIEDLADQVAARGVRRVEGDIVGDDSAFPWNPYPPSWTQDDALADFGAPVSALTLNDNVIAASASPGARAGDLAKLALSPAFEYLTLENQLTTIARGGSATVHVRQIPGTRQWVFEGSIPVGHAAMAELIPVDDPALFAASALYDALTRRGVTVRGRAVARHRIGNEEAAPSTGEELASRMSPPLKDLLQTMNKISQNLHAELMLRKVGKVSRQDGTTEGGLAELTVFLKELGAAPEDWRLEDGSGLSRNALVTPRLVTQLLAHMQGSKDGELYASLLPVGGEDGTLENRLCCMGNGRGIQAKTGTLSRASALSGFADSKTEGRLAFSILVNNFSAPAAEVRQWIDKIATALVE